MDPGLCIWGLRDVASQYNPVDSDAVRSVSMLAKLNSCDLIRNSHLFQRLG